MVKYCTTPWQEYYGRKPDYSYMREIGCKAFALIQNKHNPKLYGRSLECILIRYNENAKSYCLYNRETRKVYSSYHVRFLESQDGHPRTLPQTQTFTTSQSSPPTDDAITKPISFDTPDDDEYFPFGILPLEPSFPDHPVPDQRNMTLMHQRLSDHLALHYPRTTWQLGSQN